MRVRSELTPATEVTGTRDERLGARVHTPDRWLAARVQRMIEPAGVRLELWDGSTPYAGSHEPIGEG